MNFHLIDRIVDLERGTRIVALKAVTLGEEYFADHFPRFPVLPGVLMLQGLAEAAFWLVQDAQDFSAGVILLGGARNVTYKSFVKPGSLLRLEVTCRRLELGESEFDGVGFCDEGEAVRGRFHLIHRSLAGLVSRCEGLEVRLANGARARFAWLWRPTGSQGEW